MACKVAFDKEAFFIRLLEQSGVTKGIGDDCVILGNVKNAYPRTHKAQIQAGIQKTQFCKSQTPQPQIQHKSHNALKSPHILLKGKAPLVIGMDSFCEGVHFLQEWFSPYTLAYKAFLVNYSDIVAMNATAAYAMLSIALPRKWGKSEIRECVQGISDFCKKFNIFLIGGDTISSQTLAFHITLFGFANKRTLFRDRIPLDSVLYATCDRYPSKTITQGLKVLKNLLINDKQRLTKINLKAKGRFLKPEIRAEFVQSCERFLKGGLDISDGILQEIKRLCVLNQCGFKSAVPLFAPKSRVLLQSGEAYEMLLAISPKDSLRFKRQAARHRIKLLKLGSLRKKRTILPKNTLWH
ncbi:thiamine-phosphate kinase [Helicobacter cinaedi]|uniref:thiamine-phosphate kinase n=1 Tax=Helicobacter cinaedi TaxID=213 RepID=UPI000CF0D844|nr:thiamine-phosphate kinase [Helicobacter cinaedi]AWK61757.1 thiamine-phosphate kinase [Helicobacter cinaedi]QOQ95854.1 thiamine-phosphate kinase [Helicobacter cinaedi]